MMNIAQGSFAASGNQRNKLLHTCSGNGECLCMMLYSGGEIIHPTKKK